MRPAQPLDAEAAHGIGRGAQRLDRVAIGEDVDLGQRPAGRVGHRSRNESALGIGDRLRQGLGVFVVGPADEPDRGSRDRLSGGVNDLSCHGVRWQWGGRRSSEAARDGKEAASRQQNRHAISGCHSEHMVQALSW